MYIVQMADLHIGSSTQTNPEEKELFLKSAELIKKVIPSKETILICLCGDIIDSKELKEGAESSKTAEERYTKAAELLEDFKNEIEDEYNIIIKCCPGNHDATHMEELCEFLKKVDIDTTSPSKTKLSKCYTVEIKGVETKFIFVNSCKGNQYEKGCIDYVALERELASAGQNKKIIVLHHTVMSMFDEDSSPIRNAAKLVNLIDKYDVIGVLHGHIHGREILSLGQNQCKIVGTGALLSRDNTNVNSQFNIIELKNDLFLKILNCRYQADGGNAPWDIKELNNLEISNIFTGKTFSKAYRKLMDALDVVTPIYNMRMEIKTTYREFVDDLEELLREDELKIGDKTWSYFTLAEMWERDEKPKKEDELYFNHGSYFKTDEFSGIDYVVTALKNKPTSNRIVLATYNMKNIIDSLDDKKYLPSLASIQFGKHGEKLIVHMHLRALEAKQFLKINICEIAYLLKQLEENSVSFKEVEIVISAFRVQKKEKFQCFLKSKIDKMDPMDLITAVNLKNFGELYCLIKEKRDGQETVIKTEGIETVYRAMKASNKGMIQEGGTEIYGQELIGLLKQVLETYEKLDRLHKSFSVPRYDEQIYEQKIDSLLGAVLEKLKKLEKETVS